LVQVPHHLAEIRGSRGISTRRYCYSAGWAVEVVKRKERTSVKEEDGVTEL
jgi:hypothetical protein